MRYIKPDTQHYADLCREQVDNAAAESAERIKQRRDKPYFAKVEGFLYSVSFAMAALKDLQLEYDDKLDTHKITANYDAIAVSGGESTSKQERYVARMDFLRREIAKRELIIQRYELALEQVKRVPKVGDRLANLVKWKYIDGHSNEAVWRMLGIERSTFFENRKVVIDVVYRVLPSQFLEQYRE